MSEKQRHLQSGEFPGIISPILEIIKKALDQTHKHLALDHNDQNSKPRPQHDIARLFNIAKFPTNEQNIILEYLIDIGILTKLEGQDSNTWQQNKIIKYQINIDTAKRILNWKEK